MNAKQKKIAKKIQKKETKKTDVFNCKKNDSIVIGIDVHKKTYHVAVRKNSKQVVDWSMEHDDQKLLNIVIKAKNNIQKIVYEAGPTGYALARLLQKYDLPVGVVAPGKTPRAANEGNKSDKSDSKKLALLAEQKQLKYIQPPNEEEDSTRQVTRRREDLTDKSAKVKVQIKGFLLYHNINVLYKGAWTLEFIKSLRELVLNDDLKYTLDSYLDELEFFEAQKKLNYAQLKKVKEQRVEEAEILLSHPGVGPITMYYFLAELYCISRFKNKRQISAYIGLAPRTLESGESKKGGGRLRGGRDKLRNCLIEAAWVWVKVDPSAKAFYHRLFRNTGSSKKAITAVAHQVAINLWSMLTHKQKYKDLL